VGALERPGRIDDDQGRVKPDDAMIRQRSRVARRRRLLTMAAILYKRHERRVKELESKSFGFNRQWASPAVQGALRGQA